jgi:hypothetical protein
MSLSLLPGLYVLAVSSVLPPVQGVVAVAPEVEEPPVVARLAEPAINDHCRVGLIVMVPDGREGRVTSRDGESCTVLAYGEAYVSLWNEDMIEPVYPQELQKRAFGH